MNARVLRFALLLALAGCHRSSAAARPKLMFVAEGSLHGQVEDCGCHLRPTGGLARRTTALSKLRKGNVVLALDTGDALFPPGQAPPTRADRRRADLIAQSFSKLNYAALAVGELDLRDGLGALRARMSTFQLPYVSSNLVDDAGAHPFPAWRLIPTRSGPVGVVGVTALTGPVAGLHALDPLSSLRSAVTAVRALHPVAVVALVDAPSAALSALLQGSDVDLALVGHEGRTGMLERTPPTYATGEKGRSLDAVTLELGSGPLVDGNAASDAASEVKVLDALADTLSKRDALATTPQAHAAMHAELALNRKRRAQAQARALDHPNSRTISWRLVTLTDAYAADPAWDAAVKAEVAADGHAPGR